MSEQQMPLQAAQAKHRAEIEREFGEDSKAVNYWDLLMQLAEWEPKNQNTKGSEAQAND